METNSFPKIPFIQFPSEWKIRFMKGGSPTVLRLFIKDDKAQNSVSVILFCHLFDGWTWETVTSFDDENGDFGGVIDNSEERIPLNEITVLVSSIQKKLHEDIFQYYHDEYFE